MNYIKVYNMLIENAKKRSQIKECGVYCEIHHIIPKSWGGTDEKFNLVKLTAKEHYIAHCLLVKISKGTKNWYSANQALINMGRVISPEKRNSASLYESARKVIAKEVSIRHTNTIIVKDKETGIRIGRVSKDHPKVLSGEWVFFHVGLVRSEEYRKKKSKPGSLNPRYSGITNEEIINYYIEFYDKFHVISPKLLNEYVKLKYDITLPTIRYSAKGFRQEVLPKNIKKIIAIRYNIPEKDVIISKNGYLATKLREDFYGDKN